MKMRNLGTKLLGTVLAVCMMGSVFSANGIESRAATDDLPIDGFYEYDIPAKKETRFTITIPEGNDVDMTMEGSAEQYLMKKKVIRALHRVRLLMRTIVCM